jgi:hypothetical protein
VPSPEACLANRAGAMVAAPRPKGVLTLGGWAGRGKEKGAPPGGDAP